MRHKWIKNEKYKKDGFSAKYECETCGAIKYKLVIKVGKIFKSDWYWERSGQSLGEHKVECLDWNDNTLD